MTKLFGTDGIRGIANQHPITCEIALQTGRAIGFFAQNKGFKSVVVGKDTRISGDMLESAIASGIASVGINALLAGVIPTPGVAYLTKIIEEAGAGVVISASHNPYLDNGIKIFKHDGYKLSDDEENQVETFITDPQIVPRSHVGRIFNISSMIDKYIYFLSDKFPKRKLSHPLKIVIDCSNGAASDIVPKIFKSPLFDSVFLFNSPDGKNINLNCGSQHTETLMETVLSLKADIGIALDGDADRFIAVDETGKELTGDTILAICAKHAKENNMLPNNIVVSTTMSNMGLTTTLKSMSIRHERSEVGDRKVLELMNQTGAVIGGEDSGHLIFLNDHSTGDGILSAIKLLEVMVHTGKSLSELTTVIKILPQILLNVEVDVSRPDFMKIDAISNEISAVESELENNGRVLIRYSGTQPLLRVMVEGPEEKSTMDYAQRLCRVIKDNI